MRKCLALAFVVAMPLVSSLPTSARVVGRSGRLVEAVMACNSESELLDYFRARSNDQPAPESCHMMHGKVWLQRTDARSHCIKDLTPEAQGDTPCYRIPKGYMDLDSYSGKDGERLLLRKVTERQLILKIPDQPDEIHVTIDAE